MENIDIYKNTIKQYAESETNYSFQTIGKDYALVVLERILLTAKKTVRYTTDSFYGEDVERQMAFIEALCSFLAIPNSRLFIIVTNLPEDISHKDSLNPFYRLFQHSAYREGRIEIRHSHGGHFINNDKNMQICVADSIMYRIESDTSKCIASCNFNDSAISKKFETVFDSAFETILSKIELNNIFAE